MAEPIVVGRAQDVAPDGLLPLVNVASLRPFGFPTQLLGELAPRKPALARRFTGGR